MSGGSAGADEAAVRAALNEIHDPCSVAAGLPAGLEEMGLVRSLEVVPGERGAVVRLAIGVTEPGCVMGYPFAEEAERRVGALPGVERVEVDFDHAHDWEPADMAPGYRRRLESHRAARRRATGDGVAVRSAEGLGGGTALPMARR